MIVAAVPVKPLPEAKSRLAGRLSTDVRATLVLALAEQTIEALHASGVIASIAVVTNELRLAQQKTVRWLPDAGSLNGSLERAVEWAEGEQADGLLIVPGDLPLLTPEAVKRLISSARERNGIVVAPTHDGGTGALLLHPPTAIPPSFGPGSYRRHVMEGTERSLDVRTHIDEAFLRDLDTADDLDGLRQYLPV
jgi:2-phospho-L-lactate guanylyltransferase